MHKRHAVAALALMLIAAPALAQPGSPNTTPGTVTRVILVRIKPGHADQYWDKRFVFLLYLLFRNLIRLSMHQYRSIKVILQLRNSQKCP